MNETLYNRMDWAAVEAIVYSEEDQPQRVLGAHIVEEGILIQTFFPGAEKISVVLLTGERIRMDLEDEAGFYAALLPGREIPKYRFEAVLEDGSRETYDDPYLFPEILTERDTAKIGAGICYDIYDKLGAHPMTVGGVQGVHFAVWAPNALRVSLVGDFVRWDGRRLPMRRLGDSGIFELFVPGLPEGTIYKYEVKAKGGLTFLKADPYARAAELRPGTASVVSGFSGFAWTDEAWIREREDRETASSPLCILEVDLASWRTPEDGRHFYNYRELAPMLADYVKKMGYTHVELLPVMEHMEDDNSYQTIGYYAPTARFGSPGDLMVLINYLHGKGIGVILDLAASQFPRDLNGLCGFDGTCLYEHQDPRQGVHPLWNTLLYNYGRPEVKNFLIGSALYWTKVFHADGLRLNDVSSILYLDYGKSDGQWVANLYGGNENLEGEEFLKHLNSVLHKEVPGVLTIAEESVGWPKVTEALDRGGLGFDLKWNGSYVKDLLSYMELDPVFRGHHHGELTFSMVYHYSERFLLPLSHDLTVYGKGSFLSQMPGRAGNKLANLRVMYGYQMAHPGKKLLFAGQERLPDTEALQPDPLAHYVSQLQKLYLSSPALYELDFDPDGFEWINAISANENILVFLRRSRREEETLLILCNFSSLTYENYKVGVPFAGKYKEIFNSDREEFGGSGRVNPRLKNAKLDECDGREYSIRVLVPPMGISVFSCTKAERKVSENEKARAGRQRSAKRMAAGTTKAKSGQKTTRKKTDAIAGEKPLSLKEELERRIAQEEQGL